MSEDALVAHMIGRPLQLAFPERDGEGRVPEVLLDVAGLRGDRFGPVDLKVEKGEILGIAGAEGNGQVQFLRALAGVERPAGHRYVRRRRAEHEVAARGPARRESCS